MKRYRVVRDTGVCPLYWYTHDTARGRNVTPDGGSKGFARKRHARRYARILNRIESLRGRMNRTYSITDSLFGDGYTVHASTLIAGGPIVGVGKSNTIATATAAADLALDMLIEEYNENV